MARQSTRSTRSRRNAATWSGPETNTNLTTIAGTSREGYTFQTALGLWMGMNHMNGRVQYLSTLSLGEFANALGWAGPGIGTIFDYISTSNGGMSWSQFGTNAGVGLGGMVGGTLTVLFASQYFIGTTLYNHFYPGGAAQAWPDLGGNFL